MKLVLGIESSCDETAVALVREDRTILAQALSSQREHEVYGGVVPEIAARAHLAQCDRLYAQVLRESGKTLAEVDAIAATAGPGLIGGVIVGVMFGKALAAASGKPFLAVNHLEGHALTVRLTHEAKFPYLLLLVSGGHCQILVVRELGRYERLGGTKDDALGEAFDKCGKLLGLSYPGGPAIERAAAKGTPRFALPRPLHGTAGCDFSFSGLKTAVRLLVEQKVAREGKLTEALVNDIAASFQQAVIEVVQDRLANALTITRSMGLTALAVAGGVAANQTLRAGLESLAVRYKLPLLVAPPALCTDNAAMIAWAGMEHFLRGETSPLDAEPRARWPLSA